MSINLQIKYKVRVERQTHNIIEFTPDMKVSSESKLSICFLLNTMVFALLLAATLFVR